MFKTGESAGTVWKILDGSENKELKFSEIVEKSKESGLTKEETFVGLGWLAKENKISFNKKGKSYSVVLIN